MKSIVYLLVLSACIAGYFHERHQVGILGAQVIKLQQKLAEWEARDVMRADDFPQRWGKKYLTEDVRR